MSVSRGHGDRALMEAYPMTYLNTPDDCQWLRDVHVPDAPPFGAAVVDGNEDAPTRVTLYTLPDPLVTDTPCAVYAAHWDDDAGYILVREVTL